MKNPAEVLDDTMTWWDCEKFKVGYLLGFLSALGLVWLGK